MLQRFLQRAVPALVLLLMLWFGLKYLLPLVMPFLLGGALALMAEPAAQLFRKKLHFPSGLAAATGVSATFLLLLCLIFLVCSVLVRELGQLAGVLPSLVTSVREGCLALEDWLISMSSAAPEGLQPLLTKSVLRLSHSGNQLLDQALGQLPRVATGVLSHMSDGLLLLGTGLISAFLISSRLPRIRRWFASHLPEDWQLKIIPRIRAVRRSLGKWLGAQARLALITFSIVTVGLLVLAVPYAPLYAMAIALVDAVPLLGTGLILVPWALVCFLQGDSLRAIGLLVIFAAATLTRSIMEPKLVGKQLGLDPLVTLIALYFGYRIWGLPGMILSPLLAVAVTEAVSRA